MKGKGIVFNWVWFAVLISTVSLTAATDQKTIDSGSSAIKADLRVLGVQAERIGFTADGAHRVRVRVAVVNSALGAVCAGPFMVSLEKRTPPASGFVLLEQKSVARLCTDPAAARMATAALDFEDTVRTGEQREYRATADSTRLVVEANEGNNTALSEIYVAKSFCTGVDLAMTSVEVVRGTDGDVFIRAYGRNRCIGSCSGGVKFTFAVAVPATDWLPAVQSIGVPIAALQEFATAGVGVYSRSDRTVTYRVRIDPESAACVDSNPGNNECLVTFAASETRKTQNCH